MRVPRPPAQMAQPRTCVPRPLPRVLRRGVQTSIELLQATVLAAAVRQAGARAAEQPAEPGRTGIGVATTRPIPPQRRATIHVPVDSPQAQAEAVLGCSTTSAHKPVKRFACDLGRDGAAADEFPVAHLETTALEFRNDPPTRLIDRQSMVLRSV
jgi:hypothetical protein